MIGDNFGNLEMISLNTLGEFPKLFNLFINSLILLSWRTCKLTGESCRLLKSLWDALLFNKCASKINYVHVDVNDIFLRSIKNETRFVDVCRPTLIHTSLDVPTRTRPLNYLLTNFENAVYSKIRNRLHLQRISSV